MQINITIFCKIELAQQEILITVAVGNFPFPPKNCYLSDQTNVWFV